MRSITEGDFVQGRGQECEGYMKVLTVTITGSMYTSPICQVMTVNGLDTYNINRLEYVRGPFRMSEVIQLPSGAANIISLSNGYVDVCDLSWFARASYSELGLIEAIYGTPKSHSPSDNSAASSVYHHCTEFAVWPFGEYKRHCKSCGEWEK